ncbi:DUF6874 family protein [Ferribacterium limneticum]|uniref:DUF6874 family protein n=1 Tax=Ferribacterium limneticum TaxID=76259 RepID=UPI001CF81961|nr:hypothetical protein [Ferribacterium limneticum]UCV26737.1 hypothetical protein KI617_10490 [Ferribacterium limneticum]UCV30654.1 hypothetical protein KI608_10490 [Ferribacterium limneticum]
MIKFEVSYKDAGLINKLVERALALECFAGQDRLELEMDIVACHANGCQLALQRLLEADDFNFGHDISGIQKYIDRSTGKLTNFFLPRYSL